MFSLDTAGASLRSVCEAVSTGSLSPHVAAAHALIAGGSVDDAIHLLDATPPDAGARPAIVSFLREHRAECDDMAAFYRQRGALPPSGLEEETVLATGRFFDDALQISPHASVALYSLGSAALLQRATDEVVACMRGHQLLGPRKRTLELGCGTGRMQLALAPHVMEAAGVDVSAAMIAAAQKRRGPLTGVRFFHAPAHRLAAARDSEYDVVFAVDSFPYIVNAGPEMVASTFAEMRRVLRSTGQAFLFNYSYRGDDNRDMADVADFARAFGLELVSFTAHAFRQWDGSVFQLRVTKPS
jgi:ubiquinone/menaquinone biosynthesis C-methylase UbiE